MEIDAHPSNERAAGGDADATVDVDLPPGTLVGGYRIEGLLGRGGMGAVYSAAQPEIGARVAIKVLAAARSRDPRLGRRFVDEARAVNQIRHPNIVDIFAFGRLPDGRQYFVMERLDGQTLAARLARGPLPVSEARRLLLQICEALEAAHAERIVHRDLKPENIWIATPRHGQPYAKILDFGIAKLLEDHDTAAATEAGLAVGTPCYMSPEQCRGDAVDARTDVYALGVVLYFMWAGRLPFGGRSFVAVASQQITAAPPPPSTHRPVPARLESVILSCLEKDPALRPQSAKALGQALDAALTEALPGETLPGASAHPQPTPGRRRRRRTLAGAVAAALAATLAGAWLAMGARLAASAAPAPAPIVMADRPASAAAAANARLAMRAGAAPSQPAAAAAGLQRPAPINRPFAPPRARVRRATEPTPPLPPAPAPVPPTPSPLDERGFLRENPFR
jgi:serine/threonine-protein kinase